MKIITGHRGEPHITPNDQQGMNQGIFGTGNYILDVGNKFNATLTNANTVTLEDGEGIMQGVHFRIEPGLTDSVGINNGTTGYNRIDLICARYSKDVSTGIETVNLMVFEGTPTTGIPEEPTYIEGDIRAGDTMAYFPLWKVTLTGLVPALSSVATTIHQPPSNIIDLGSFNNQNNSGTKTLTALDPGLYIIFTSGTLKGASCTTYSLAVSNGTDEVIKKSGSLHNDAASIFVDMNGSGAVLLTSQTSLECTYSVSSTGNKTWDVAFKALRIR